MWLCESIPLFTQVQAGSRLQSPRVADAILEGAGVKRLDAPSASLYRGSTCDPWMVKLPEIPVAAVPG